jgi:hypothetical protein
MGCIANAVLGTPSFSPYPVSSTTKPATLAKLRV